MTFTMKVKQELCAVQLSDTNILRAHLAGIICFGAMVVGEGESRELKLRTENRGIAEYIKNILCSYHDMPAEIQRNGKIYAVVCAQRVTLLLKDLGLMHHDMVKFAIDPFLVKEESSCAAFLSGAFLTGGYVKNPENGYHFEIKTHYMDLSRDLSALFSDLGFDAKYVTRKSEYVVYVKQSDAICDILSFMGATDCMFEILNEKMLKSTYNKVTRRVNCESANLNKTADAAAQQRAAILKIRGSVGLGALPKSLEEIAYLRLENPEASLAELGEMLQVPISKSGVNQRMKKLIARAAEIDERNGCRGTNSESC